MINKDVKKINHMIENRLWLLDIILKVYFAYMTFFDKPFWCQKRSATVTNDCTQDIYGNDYNLWTPLPFRAGNSSAPAMLIMLYFILKHYAVYLNLNAFKKISKSARLTRLIFMTGLGLLHFLFHFLVRDNVVTTDTCSIIRLLFIITLM